MFKGSAVFKGNAKSQAQNCRCPITTLTSLIQTNYMLWKKGFTHRLTPPFTLSTPVCHFCLLYFLLIDSLVPSLYLISYFSACLTWNRCCLGAGNLSTHCCIIAFCHVVNLCWTNVWVSPDCFSAPSPRGRREGSSAKSTSCTNLQDLTQGMLWCKRYNG